MPPADIRQFLQPALDVDGRQVRGSKNELNCHNIVLRRLCPCPSVWVGDKCLLVKGQHLTVRNIDGEQAPPEIEGPSPLDHDTRRAAWALVPVRQAPGLFDLPDGSAFDNLKKIDRGALTLGFTRLEGSDGQRRTVRQVVHAPVKQD